MFPHTYERSSVFNFPLTQSIYYNKLRQWDKFHLIAQSIGWLLTLSQQYVLVTCLTHGMALEGGEGGECQGEWRVCTFCIFHRSFWLYVKKCSIQDVNFLLIGAQASSNI